MIPGSSHYQFVLKPHASDSGASSSHDVILFIQAKRKRKEKRWKGVRRLTVRDVLNSYATIIIDDDVYKSSTVHTCGMFTFLMLLYRCRRHCLIFTLRASAQYQTKTTSYRILLPIIILNEPTKSVSMSVQIAPEANFFIFIFFLWINNSAPTHYIHTIGW